jgi:hypothetical protein
MTKLPIIFGNGKTFSGYQLRRTGTVILFALFSTLSMFAQQVDVQGTILDEATNVSVIGATIRVKGQQSGTVTDSKGEFRLKVDKLPVTLLVSFVGYKYQEIDVYESVPASFYLVEEQNRLNEVVITALGIS